MLYICNGINHMDCDDDCPHAKPHVPFSIMAKDNFDKETFCDINKSGNVCPRGRSYCIPWAEANGQLRLF